MKKELSYSPLPAMANMSHNPGSQETIGVPNVINQETSSDWQEYTAPDGRRYFYNKSTKISSWEKPLELMTPLEKVDSSTVWKEFTTAEGKKYYFNKETKQSTWAIPKGLKLARGQAEKEASRRSQSAMVPNTHAPTTVAPCTLNQQQPNQQQIPESVEQAKIDRRKKSKKKAVRHEREASPDRAKPWTNAEVIALTKAYLTATENNVKGSAVIAKQFWLNVLDAFHYIMDPENIKVYRNRDSVTGKWRDMGPKITHFYCIFSQLTQESGADDMDMVSRAHTQYRMQMGSKFQYYECWNICRSNPKWEEILQDANWAKLGMAATSSQSSGSKRSRAAA